MITPNNPDNSESPEKPEIHAPQTDVPANVESGMTEVTGKIEDILGIDTIEDPKHKEMVRVAWAFLQNPGEKNISEIMFHSKEMEKVFEPYHGIGSNAPDIVNTVYDRFDLLRRQHHIAEARKELEQPAPDLLRLLASIREVSTPAVLLTPDIKKEIDQLKTEITARNLRNETYDRMVEISSVIAGAVPHLIDRSSIMTAGAHMKGLESGDPKYFELVQKALLKRMRDDAGKNGAESQEVLRGIADKIEALIQKA